MELGAERPTLQDGHPIRALGITILCQVLYGPFYAVGLIKASGLCHLSAIRSGPVSIDIGPCPEADTVRIASGVCTVLMGLLLTSFLGYKAGGFKLKKRPQFLALLGVSLFFVLAVFLLPIYMLFGS